MKFLKSKKLQKGDTIAIVSPSWGGPSVFPHIYESGLQTLEILGLKIKEFPSARMDANLLYQHPEFRAKDINDAFADPEVNAIFASIGGDDSVRILPYLDIKRILENPKMLLGYSDTSTLNTYLNQLGLVTFHGPSIMAWFSQWDSLEDTFQQHISDFLFTDKRVEYPVFDFYSNGYLDWSDKDNVGKTNEHIANDGFHFLQGDSPVSGELYGWCIEVLEFMKGTDFWPQKKFWHNKIFFLETSENKPSIEQVKRMLRNYGMQGIFDQISALFFGRARDYSDEEKKALDKAILQIVRDEFKNDRLLIVSNMDFGHTDPQWILPLWIQAKINPINQSFKLLESPLS